MNLFAIVVTYNGAKWIDKCFGSLESSSIPVKILAVDNGSTDNTPDIIRQKFPQVTIMETGRNLGFGRANNIGIKYALEHNCEYIYLLNQDAWVEPDTLEGLVRIMKNNPEYGIISPMQYTGNGMNLDKNFQHSLSPYYCENILNDLVINRSMKEVYFTKSVMAAHWMIRSESLRKIGGFMPLFKHYGEDNNLIHRMIYHGWNIGISPLYKGYHDREDRKITEEKKAHTTFAGYLVCSVNINKKWRGLAVSFISSVRIILLLNISILKKITYIYKMCTTSFISVKYRVLSRKTDTAYRWIVE